MASASIQVLRVDTQEGWKDFVQFPFDLYSNDPHWVPPLRTSVRYALSVEKNPFYHQAYRIPLIAYENGKVLGRIVGIIDDAANRTHREAIVNFGFFECVERFEVAEALVNAVIDWARSRGMQALRGPCSPSMNHERGLLIQGFQDDPAYGMPYQHTYYENYLSRLGFKKFRDLYSFEWETGAQSSDRTLAKSEKLKENSAVTFRPIRMRDFDQELDLIYDIYSEQEDWEIGQAPLDRTVFKADFQRLKLAIDPEIFLIAEVRGEVAGYSIALPDLNGALKRNSSGQCWPTGWLKLLWNVRGPGRSSSLSRYRMVQFVVKKRFEPLGIDVIVDLETQRRAAARGYARGEIGGISEHDQNRRQFVEGFCGPHSKMVRIYERALT